MKPALHVDMKIADILSYYPETRGVFQTHGFGALTTEDGMRVLAPFLSLATALRRRNIDQKGFLQLLQNAAYATDEQQDAPGLESYQQQGDLTLLALMPCGLKMPFSKAVTAFLEKFKKENDFDIRYAVEGNVNQELSYYSYVRTLESVEELPDIIISSDFNAFYGKKFQQQFVSTGHLTGYGHSTPSEPFIKAGVIDPLGQYTLLGVNPLVMVANLDELGSRDLPTSWSDLLKPEWQQSITLRGSNEFFCHAVLLPTFQQYGTKGLVKLAENVLHGLHPAQMIKHIDSGAPGAIYVMPEFFAHRAKKQERIKIIWPEEGALASPVTLQVKQSRIAELKPILDYLTGVELAQTLNGARFPVPHKDVSGKIQKHPLYWPGWDFFRNNDLLEVNAEIDRIFLPLVRKPAIQMVL